MCLSVPATADTNHGGQIWGSIQVTAPISDDVFVTGEVQPRFSTRNAATAPITIIPPIISWRKSESLILSAGYLYAFIDGARLPRDLHENRFIQQASYRLGAIGRVGIRAQTRFEQRQRSTGKDWNLRVAQQILLATPLTKKESGARSASSQRNSTGTSPRQTGAPARAMTISGLSSAFNCRCLQTRHLNSATSTSGSGR